MDHESCRHLLARSRYVDGDLGEELCAEIDRHLQDCNNCRVVIDSLRKRSTCTMSRTLPQCAQRCAPAPLPFLDLGEFLERKLEM